MAIHDRKEAVEIIETAVGRTTQLLPKTISSIEDIISGIGIWFIDSTIPGTKDEIGELFQWDRIRKGQEFAKGFPGIVLTAAIGCLIDPSYDPQNNFYAINPRPLFEKYIGPTLRDKYKAPMGKSDPLNVAKNAKVIDSEWANGRRPEYAANATVFYISWICNAPKSELENLIDMLVWCYLALSRLYNRKITEMESGMSHLEAYEVVKILIDEAPAGGDTLQIIVGAFLQAQHKMFDAQGLLGGVGDSVNATNTTSGKAGDFTEEFGDTVRIYEVTTKKVDNQRIHESADAVTKYLQKLVVKPSRIEVTFVCPLSEVKIQSEYSISPKNLIFEDMGIRFSFIELEDWLFFMLERLGSFGRTLALTTIAEYVQAASTNLEVKTVWESKISYSI